MVMGGASGSAMLEILLRARDEASDVMRGVGQESQGAAGLVNRHWKQATVVLGTAGVALEGLARSQAENTQAVNRMAVATGMSTAAIRDLAVETSNVTFPLEDALALMEQGTRLGIEGADALQEYANFWDTVADATGKSSVALAESASALATVGVDVNNLSEAQAALGFVQNNTTDGVEGFLQLLEMRGATIREFGLDVDDTAALLAVMEREMGLVGRQARQEFEQALNESDGSVENLLETLGISEETFASYRSEVDQSGDALNELAEANNATFTPMQKLKHMLDEMIFANGELIQQAANLAPLLIAVGPAARGMTLAITGAKAAMVLLAGASGIGLVLIAVAALIAIGVLLWQNWDTVTEKGKALAGFFRDTLASAVGFIGDRFAEFVGWIRNTVSAIGSSLGDAISFVTNFVDNMHSGFAPLLVLLGPAGALLTIWKFRDEFMGVFNAIRSTVGAVVNFVIARVEDLTAAVDKIKGAVEAIPTPGDVAGSLPGAGSAPANFLGDAANFLIPGRASGGPVSSGRSYVVGEQGPELFVPGSNGTIVPNGAGGTVVHIHVAGSVHSEQSLVEMVQAAWNNGHRRGLAY